MASEWIKSSSPDPAAIKWNNSETKFVKTEPVIKDLDQKYLFIRKHR